MFRSRWLRNWLKASRSRKDRRRPTVRSRKTIRLMLESLEERLTPSGFNPGSLPVIQTAGGYTALTAAVAKDTGSNTNYVIEITNSFQFASGGQVNISKLGTGSTLTIEGQNGNYFTLTGNGNRLFNINGTGQNVTFAHLTLTGGSVTNSTGIARGGAIQDQDGNVTLSAVAIQDNAVTGKFVLGGGIYVSGGGNLTIENGSVIQSNNATGSSSAGGGGICFITGSTVAISDSIISNNSAVGGQGTNGSSPGADGSAGGNASGGGLDGDGEDWTLTLTGVTLSGNSAVGGNGGNGAAGQNASAANTSGGAGGKGGLAGMAEGGGAFFYGGGQLIIQNDPAAPTTNPSEFVNNSVQSGAGGKGGNGGISTGTANNANGGTGGHASSAEGGALFLEDAVGIQVTVNNTTFSGNKASGATSSAGGAAGTGGSGSAGAAGDTLGSSGAVGGAIVIEDPVTVTIHNSTVANNTAAVSAGSHGSALAGGIADFGGALTLSKVTVQSNTAMGALADGGGIYMGTGGNLTVQGGSVVQSNRAIGTGTSNGLGNTASGGGLYVSCTNSLNIFAISDSTFSNNSAQGGQGADGATPGAAGVNGGDAYGGGVFVTGNGWNVTLTGDTFSGNKAIGGNGGNGVAGNNATTANSSGGNGGNGGGGGNALGGAGYFNSKRLNGKSTGTLTILNDADNPSTMIGNFVQGGNGGNGGNGGTSTGTANNANGGAGGGPNNAWGGALELETSTTNVANTTFYDNSVVSGNGATGGAAGTGGTGYGGTVRTYSNAGLPLGGAIRLDEASGSFTMVNSTVAKNAATTGLRGGGDVQGSGAAGGGISISTYTLVTLDNNTITQNTVSGGTPGNDGAGIAVVPGSSAPTLLNNLIQGNQGIGIRSSAPDLSAFLYTTPLSSDANNFIGTISIDAISTANNIVGNSQVQLGSVVGVDANGNPTGGPIYYPLLSGVVSVGAGNTSVLPTIAGVEGTTSANAVDEIGKPRSSGGSIDLGAVQFYTATVPVIASNPSNETVSAGTNVSFTASASGLPQPTVQWQVSTDGGKNWSNLSDGDNVSGATSSTLTLSNVTAGMNGYEYQAVFANSASSITSTAATLAVNPLTAPAITVEPSNQTVTAGQIATFTAAASGNPTPTVQWQYSYDGGKTFTNLGIPLTTLTLSVSPDMNGDEFQAVFTNSIGSTTTRFATLTVNPVPPPPLSPLPPPSSPSAPPPTPPVLNVPPLLALFDSWLGGTETVNANGTETITDSWFGIPLIVSTFDSSGDLMSVTLFGFNITFLFV